MDSIKAQQMALQQLNLRLDPVMGYYLAERLATGQPLAAISVLGVDADGAAPVHTLIAPARGIFKPDDSLTAPLDGDCDPNSFDA